MTQENVTQSPVKLFRMIQLFGPLVMLGIGVLIYMFWDHEMKNLVSGVVAFMAVLDFFTFKYLADRLEANHEA